MGKSEPAIKDLVYTAKDALAFLGRNRDSVDLVSVNVVQWAVEATELL